MLSEFKWSFMEFKWRWLAKLPHSGYHPSRPCNTRANDSSVCKANVHFPWTRKCIHTLFATDFAVCRFLEASSFSCTRSFTSCNHCSFLSSTAISLQSFKDSKKVIQVVSGNITRRLRLHCARMTSAANSWLSFKNYPHSWWSRCCQVPTP